MTDQPHECEPEEVCEGIIVELHLDLIRPVCPHHDDRTLRELIQRHAEPIAMHMVSAGIAAAAQMFKGKEGLS